MRVLRPEGALVTQLSPNPEGIFQLSITGENSIWDLEFTPKIPTITLPLPYTVRIKKPVPPPELVCFPLIIDLTTPTSSSAQTDSYSAGGLGSVQINYQNRPNSSVAPTRNVTVSPGTGAPAALSLRVQNAVMSVNLKELECPVYWYGSPYYDNEASQLPSYREFDLQGNLICGPGPGRPACTTQLVNNFGFWTNLVSAPSRALGPIGEIRIESADTYLSTFTLSP